MAAATATLPQYTEVAALAAALALAALAATTVATTMAVAEYTSWAGKRRREHKSSDTISDGGSSTDHPAGMSRLRRTTANSLPGPVG